MAAPETLFADFHRNMAVSKLLGSGAYGSVYLVAPRDRSDGRLFAMKLVRMSYLSLHPSFMARFNAEGYLSRAIRSPHIPRSYGAYFLQFRPSALGQTPDPETGDAERTYGAIFLEYIDGETLKDYRSIFFSAVKPELQDAAVLQLMMQLFSTLADMHERDIAHEDIKAENIMLDRQAVAYLIDWGFVCRPLSREWPCNGTAGSPYYMSKEALEARRAKRRSVPPTITFANDVWSLAVVFFEFLTGFYPYELRPEEEKSDDAFDLLVEKVARNDRRLDIRYPKNVPRSSAMVEKALVHAVRFRPTARQMTEEIAAELGSL